MFHGSPDCAAFPVLKQGMAGCVKEICKESPRSYLAAGVLYLGTVSFLGSWEKERVSKKIKTF